MAPPWRGIPSAGSRLLVCSLWRPGARSPTAHQSISDLSTVAAASSQQLRSRRAKQKKEAPSTRAAKQGSTQIPVVACLEPLRDARDRCRTSRPADQSGGGSALAPKTAAGFTAPEKPPTLVVCLPPSPYGELTSRRRPRRNVVEAKSRGDGGRTAGGVADGETRQ